MRPAWPAPAPSAPVPSPSLHGLDHCPWIPQRRPHPQPETAYSLAARRRSRSSAAAPFAPPCARPVHRHRIVRFVGGEAGGDGQFWSDASTRLPAVTGSDYDPRPIETSHIQLPGDVEELTELLAENTHDAW